MDDHQSVPTDPGDLRDARRLEVLEQVIERGRQTFIEVGEALLEIRESRLYRADHATFEDYCRERWGWSRSYVHRVVQSTEIVRLLPMGNIPANERHARELVPLRDQPAVLREVWSEVVAKAEATETPITAPVIRQAVRDHIRRMAAESEAEIQEAMAAWTPEQRASVAPEMMRQRGELMRLIHDIVALPEPKSYARLHFPELSSDFMTEAMLACEWLEFFCDEIDLIALTEVPPYAN